MRKTAVLLLMICFATILCSIELNIEPVQKQITEKIDDPRFETVLPQIDLRITPRYTEDEYSLMTPSLERVNTGKLVIHSPMKVDRTQGNCYFGAYEELGSCWPYTDCGTLTITEEDAFNDCFSNCKPVIEAIKKGTLSKSEFVDLLKEKAGYDENDTNKFDYFSMKLDQKQAMDYEFNMESGSSEGNNMMFVNPSVIRLRDINSEKVYICVINNLCTDSVSINSIKAKEVFIFNFGSNIQINNLVAEEKCRIYNFYGNIEIGNRMMPSRINANLSVELRAEDGSFGFKAAAEDTYMNNEEYNNILCKWQNSDYKPMNEDGEKRILNNLPVMQTGSAAFTMKIDLSENWYEFPAGAEYRGTLYFTVESIYE